MSWVTKLLKSIGMSKQEIDEVSPEELEILEKAIPEEFDAEDMAGLAGDEDAMEALDEGDEDGFRSAVARFMKSRAAEDDESEDESEEEDEDEDEEYDEDEDDGDDEGEDDVSDEDVKAAAEDLWGDDGDVDVKKAKAKPTKKSILGMLEEDDEIEDFVDGNLVLARLAKALQVVQDDRDKRITAKINGLQKSLDGLTEALGQFGRMPAGRAIPSKVRKSPLDGDGNAPDIEEVHKSVFALQEEGRLESDDALAILDAAEHGGPLWEHWKSRLDEAAAETAPE